MYIIPLTFITTTENFTYVYMMIVRSNYVPNYT